MLLIVSARTTSEYWAFYYHCLAVAPSCLLMGAGVAALRDPGAARVLGLVPGRLRQGIGAALVVGTIILLAAAAGRLIWVRDHDRIENLRAMRACGLHFVTQIPPEGRIVVRGGTMYGRCGEPVAHDRSMLFAWLDRKGFTYGDQDLSIPVLNGIAARGGRYWIAEADELKGRLGGDAPKRFRLLAQCQPGYYVYDLQSAPVGFSGSANRGVGAK
jgi:hypothetical protein